MPETIDKSKRVIDFYVKANQNKYKISKKDKIRDYSVAEMTVMAALDALFRHEYLGPEDKDYDVNKVIRTIFADSLRGQIDDLSKKEEYEQLLDNTVHNETEEAMMAKTSYFNTFIGYNSDNKDLNELLKNFDKLRETKRIGHVLWDAKGDRLESVLEHIYGTIVLIMGIESEWGYEIDYNKIIQMLLIHETEEILKGDEPDLHVPHDQELG